MGADFILLESMHIFETFHQYQTLIGLVLVLWLVWFVIKSKFKRSTIKPTDEQVQEKLSAWIPEPLVPNVDPNHRSLHPKLVSSIAGNKVTVNGKNCLNFGIHNYLGLLGNDRIQERAVAAINKYGVGSCGPRGFYGTVDVHLELEERLQKFMAVEEAIVYSYGFSTVASAIQAYCKRRDMVFVDERANFAIQKGLEASRSSVQYFKHNNVERLEELLKAQEQMDRKEPKKAAKIRRFLIVEGIYMNTGLICPLPELISLCRKYKLRIFIDESISFGTLGEHGRGVTEHYGIPRHEVDMIMGSLEWAVASIGGFCVGSSFLIEHQRLSGLGYCFSASLPPLLTVAAITSLDLMEEDPNLFKTLKAKCLYFHEKFDSQYFELSSALESPVKHLFLKKQLDRSNEENLLAEVSDKCMEYNLAVVCPIYLDTERFLPRPSLRLCISNVHDEKDLNDALEILEKCGAELLL